MKRKRMSDGKWEILMFFLVVPVAIIGPRITGLIGEGGILPSTIWGAVFGGGVGLLLRRKGQRL